MSEICAPNLETEPVLDMLVIDDRSELSQPREYDPEGLDARRVINVGKRRSDLPGHLRASCRLKNVPVDSSTETNFVK